MTAARRLAPELLAIWALLGGFAVLTAAAVLVADLRFLNAPPFFRIFGGAVAALIAINLYQRLRMPENRRTIFFLDMVAIYVSAAVLMMIYQYGLATFKAVPISDLILRADHALGFYWTPYVTFVNATPLADILQFCYTNWMREFVVALAVMTYLKRFDDMYEFTFAYLIAGVATLSTMAFFDVRFYEPLATYANAAFHHPVGAPPDTIEKLDGLRSGLDRTLDFNHVLGLVWFPSFHAGAALLLAVATRTLKFLWLPFLVFNVLIMAGILSVGGHNLMDLIAGCAVSIAALAVAGALRRSLARAAPASPAFAPESLEPA